MRYPIETTNQPGMTLYAIVHHPDGRVWNTGLVAWEAFNAGNWSLYAIPMPEQGASGYYRGAYPTAIEGVLTTEAVYIQGTPAPSIGDIPAIGLAQSQGAAVAAIADDVVAAENLKGNLGVMITGAAVSGTLSTTQATTNLPDTSDGVYAGRLVIWTSGALLRRAAYVLAYSGATRKLTFGAVPVAPTAGDTFIIV